MVLASRIPKLRQPNVKAADKEMVLVFMRGTGFGLRDDQSQKGAPSCVTSPRATSKLIHAKYDPPKRASLEYSSGTRRTLPRRASTGGASRYFPATQGFYPLQDTFRHPSSASGKPVLGCIILIIDSLISSQRSRSPSASRRAIRDSQPLFLETPRSARQGRIGVGNWLG